MAEKEAAEWEGIKALQEGWSLVLNQGAMLAMLPIEEWLSGLERADSFAHILDPTLYRNYVQSGKGELIKDDVLRAALKFKAAILKAQEQVRGDPRLQRV